MTIVVGYDGRREGRDALALAAALAPTLGEDLLVALYPSPETSFGLTSEELHDKGERMVAEGVKELPEESMRSRSRCPATRRPRGSTGCSRPSTRAWSSSARATAGRSETCSPDESRHGF